MKIPIIYGNEKYHFGEKLLSRGPNVVLRKNATGAVFKKVVFLKVLSGFQSFAGGGAEVMKGQ